MFAISDLEAAEELEQRRKSRSKIIPFTTYTKPAYQPESVHELIGEALDEVVAGNILRLMIFAPPQHGKSELTSIRLPAYFMGKRPNEPIILASYAASLAEDKSRQARDIVEGDEFANLFGARGTLGGDPVETRRDSRAVNRWRLAYPYTGGMLAVGVGGPITGHGAMLGIIDDPFENWEQAQSPTYRIRAWEWYRTTFRTRIWEGGAIVLIMTRWHENDLAGMILADQADEWTVLRLPAIAETQEERDHNHKKMHLPLGAADPLGREDGEPLAPKRFSLKALKALQKDVGTLAWAGEYQGAPTAPEGNRFKRWMFPIVDAPPGKAKRVRYWDKAGTKGGNGARTAGVLIAVTDEGMTCIEDVVVGRFSDLERETVIRQTAELDAMKYNRTVKIYVEQEPGSGGKESAQSTIRNLRGFAVYPDPPSGNKDVRLEPFAAQAEAKNVSLLRCEWNHDYIEEMTAVPNGALRDQADATAGAYNKAAEQKSGRMKKAGHSGLYKSRGK